MSDRNTPKLIWSVAASRDIIHLRTFIEPHNSEAARRAAKAIKKAAMMLLEFPAMGKIIEGRQERQIFIPFGKSGYDLRYRLQGGTIIVLRVWHALEDQ